MNEQQTETLKRYREALEYIASAGLAARHYEDIARAALFDHAKYANEFLRMASRGETACDICGGRMLPMYGGGWDNDRFVCTNSDCGAEIVFATSSGVPNREDCA